MTWYVQSKKPLLILVVLFAQTLFAQKSVLTQHNDNNRSGWYDNETILNKTNVSLGSFGKIFSRSVDDQVYAQPLVKLNLAMPAVGNKNVVFVATVNNTVYAFDADSANVAAPYWQVSLTPTNSRVVNRFDETGACGGFYRDFSNNMGIVGTPVIDSTTNIMYVVARTVDTTNGAKNFRQHLHAIDITTGSEMPNSPTLISATVDGTGDGNSGGKIAFDPLRQNQRCALLLLNGIVYIAWSSHCDWGPYHGWVMGYDKSTLQQKYVYNSTPDGYNGGIWMSGGGPSADEQGNLYVAVGNGSVGKNGNAANVRNRSESALKLSPSGTSLNVQDYFTPKNFQTLEGADLDFGVTQIMLIPGTNRAIVGAKDGHIYLLDRNNMGGYNALTNNVPQTIDLGNNSFLRSSMSYFKGNAEYVYSWSENSLLRAYPFNRTSNTFDLNNTVVSGLQGPTGHNGAVLSVSSNGSADSTAILWASYAANGDANQSVRPGILRAIDASDVTKELWNSSIYPDDNVGNYAKFNCPTVANGKVYLATFSNQLIVYGLKDNSSVNCSAVNIALHKPCYASSTQSAIYPAANAVDGDTATRWSSEFSNLQYIYIDFGQRYDMCRVTLRWETAIGRDFKIQVSEDGIIWTDAAIITSNTSMIDAIPVHVSGRYIRVNATKRGTSFGYSLYEFEVNGQPAPSNCGIPVNLSSSNILENGAVLHWTGNDTTKYVVQYKTVTAVDWNRAVSATNTITLKDLSCNTPYQYRVQKICSNNDTSDFSASAGFTTLECNSSANCNPLPTRWSTEDIGNPGLPGTACYEGGTGTFQLKGSGGHDYWDTKDELRFAYKTISAGGELIARITDQDNANQWDKVGIMVRESLAEGSRYAFICLTAANGAAFETRSVTDNPGVNTNTGFGIKAPYWIKLAIIGTNYTGYISPDGLKWTKIGHTVDLGFGNGLPAYAGLAITSRDNAVLSTAHADNVSMGSALLPLELLSFTGRLSLNHSVVLDWITTRETRTNYFVVERTKDNWNYTSIDTVYAENNGEFTQDYDVTDYHPLDGTNYYRIKIVDVDGKINYSPIVAVKVSEAKSPLMYPNPSSNFVNIVPGSETIRQVNIYDLLGKAVVKLPQPNLTGSIQIPTYNMASGFYFVEIRTSNLVYLDKLIIHH